MYEYISIDLLMFFKVMFNSLLLFQCDFIVFYTTLLR